MGGETCPALTLSLQDIVALALESNVFVSTEQGDFSQMCFLVLNWMMEFSFLFT